MQCEIVSCSRCNVDGICELSLLDKGDKNYNDPTRCAHRKFKNKDRGDKCPIKS